MLFQSVANARSGVPLTPANVTTPGVPDTGLIASGSNEFILLFDLAPRQLGFPSQPVVQRQPARDPPVVLRVERQVRRRASESDRRSGRCPRSPRQAGTLASALPVFAAPRLLVMSGVNVRLPDDPRSRILVVGASPELAAELERVRAAGPRHRVEDLRDRESASGSARRSRC